MEQYVRTVPGKDPQSAMMGLRSYTVTDAVQLVNNLRTSLRTCTSFSTLDEGESYGDPKQLPDPQVGDDAVSYRLTQTVPSIDEHGDEDGGPPVHGYFHFVVVRSGATIAAYYETGNSQDLHLPEVPMTVVKAQADKLAHLPALR